MKALPKTQCRINGGPQRAAQVEAAEYDGWSVVVRFDVTEATSAVPVVGEEVEVILTLPRSGQLWGYATVGSIRFESDRIEVTLTGSTPLARFEG